jgi:hypothetical protein
MDMGYSSEICNVCGKLPSMGWLYECQQDRIQSYLVNDLKNTNLSRIIETFQVRDLKILGFSHSVVEQAKKGLYTDAQLEILKNQKDGVKNAIENQTRLQFPINESNGHDIDGELHPDVTLRKKKNWPTKKPDGPQSTSGGVVIDARCHLKCCHVSFVECEGELITDNTIELPSVLSRSSFLLYECYRRRH